MCVGVGWEGGHTILLGDAFLAVTQHKEPKSDAEAETCSFLMFKLNVLAATANPTPTPTPYPSSRAASLEICAILSSKR